MTDLYDLGATPEDFETDNAKCPHWNNSDFTCSKGTDCECVEGQHENIDNADVTGWPVTKEATQ